MKAFDAGLSDLRILVVDDEPTNVLLLTGILERAGYTRVESTTDPTEIVRICRKIIRAHEGEIWAESEGPGKGACFLFTLPVATPHGS